MKMTRDEFMRLERKSITLIGMSGVGKTMLARKLPTKAWFHFSADYRIGTRYLSEPILDNIKEQAMQIDFLRDLLRSDSIYIGSAMTFDNLELMSKFLGKIGNRDLGGLPLNDFERRQKLHHRAEVASMLDVASFIRKAQSIYGYDHFVNDASGSICELDDASVLSHLIEHTVIIYIEAGGSLEQEVIKRQVMHPKPLYFGREFLHSSLMQYMSLERISTTDEINPDHFVRWIFPNLVRYRRPKYEAIAKYGYTIQASDAEQVRDEYDFLQLIGAAMEQPKANTAT